MCGCHSVSIGQHYFGNCVDIENIQLGIPSRIVQNGDKPAAVAGRDKGMHRTLWGHR